jgi:hypothetical protein
VAQKIGSDSGFRYKSCGIENPQKGDFLLGVDDILMVSKVSSVIVFWGHGVWSQCIYVYMFSDVNIWAALVSALALLFLGSVWYSPLMFGPIWIRLSGFDMDDRKLMTEGRKKMPLNMLLSFVANTVFAIGLTLLLSAFEVATLWQALLIGLIVLVGFIMTKQLEGVLWGSQPWGLYWLNISYAVVSILAMILIVYSWIF